MGRLTRPLIGLTGSHELRQSAVPGVPLQAVMLTDDYARGVERAGGLPVVVPYLADEASAIELGMRLDGLVLTGGNDVDPNLYGQEPLQGLGALEPERDRLEMLLVQVMRREQKPVLGICRGMQMLNVVLGGTLYQDLPRQWKGKIQHSQKAPRNACTHTVKLKPGSRVAQCYGKTAIRVNSFHHQAVKDLAPLLKPVGWDSEGLVEAAESDGRWPVVAVQWHPENLWREDEGAMALFHWLVEAAASRAADLASSGM
ncbi:gamma-glutamyl-gamma-aminobutyrate hydrolase family protein [Alicyclobacillus sendaiensis]|uniref:Gamma-glutamyl-gamma-aminobutyrate hydrolase family protein n=1 Tax=Alicyclobacillus sendaiensis PA2 TaxID=3029425 RepID=A0ABT6XYT9_ALISE|nr:gamma-glutamyl-gamma-aminobutyrate hydrolase family protein [Alicyclobacillus sendaiensis]MDI9260249.1 gamma-glutamyl-gamma-aminobutyrate hydrolase family protein [Alicyclobacillus sendaiensis PA2]